MSEGLFPQLASISGARIGLYCVVTLLTCLSPGPNVLLMISTGLRAGPRAALSAVAGIMLASAVYVAIASLGVIAVIAASPRLFTLIRYAGAAYLIYLGLRLLMSTLRADAVARGMEPAASGQSFWQGFVTHISNPKAVLFWTAVLPQFIDTATPATPQVLTLGVLGMAIDAVVLASYGLLAAAARASVLAHGFSRWIDLAAAMFFMLTGSMLALMHGSA